MYYFGNTDFWFNRPWSECKTKQTTGSNFRCQSVFFFQNEYCFDKKQIIWPLLVLFLFLLILSTTLLLKTVHCVSICGILYLILIVRAFTVWHLSIRVCTTNNRMDSLYVCNLWMSSLKYKSRLWSILQMLTMAILERTDLVIMPLK